MTVLARCRSQGNDFDYPWGNETPNCNLANFNHTECGTGSLEVCSLPEGNTDQGVCDMAGNIWEWVQDEWHDDYTNAPNNGLGWCETFCPYNAHDLLYNAQSDVERILRSGGWSGTSSNIRSRDRTSFNPFHHFYHTGGRLAR